MLLFTSSFTIDPSFRWNSRLYSSKVAVNFKTFVPWAAAEKNENYQLIILTKIGKHFLQDIWQGKEIDWSLKSSYREKYRHNKPTGVMMSCLKATNYRFANTSVWVKSGCVFVCKWGTYMNMSLACFTQFHCVCAVWFYFRGLFESLWRTNFSF